jgi:hypothetical protein
MIYLNMNIKIGALSNLQLFSINGGVTVEQTAQPQKAIDRSGEETGDRINTVREEGR